ncbi:MAG: hypothetical protein HUU57_08410 [Bdellovibrio sp.]|nr:hypothetical protein [Bdellovibrio sp.]
MMNTSYIGENLGVYIDPVTRQAWNVKYLDAKERLAHMITSKDGYFFDANGKKVDSEFDADSLHFEDSLIVINKNKEILVLFKEERGRFHHSTLSAGENVIFAGTATFSDGKLRSLSDQSGHYKPDPLQFMVALRTLHLMGVDLSQTRIEGNFPQKIFATPSMTPTEVKENLGPLFEDRPLSLNDIKSLIWRP